MLRNIDLFISKIGNSNDYYKNRMIRYLREAMEENDDQSIVSILKHSPDINILVPYHGLQLTCLAYAILRNKADLATKLIKLGADILKPVNFDNRNVSMLTLSMLHVNTSIVKSLLEAGANPNERLGEEYLRTNPRAISDIIWHGAALNGNKEVVAYLLEHAQELEMNTSTGVSILDLLNPSNNEKVRVMYAELTTAMNKLTADIPSETDRLTHIIPKIAELIKTDIEHHHKMTDKKLREIVERYAVNAAENEKPYLADIANLGYKTIMMLNDQILLANNAIKLVSVIYAGGNSTHHEIADMIRTYSERHNPRTR